MHKAKKQAKGAMERKPRDREAWACLGSLGWELCALPRSGSSCVEKKMQLQWVGSVGEWQAVGHEGGSFVFVLGQFAGAFAPCSRIKTHGFPCRGIWIHFKGEGTPSPYIGMASKKPLCV